MTPLPDHVRVIIPFESDEPYRVQARRYVCEWWAARGQRPAAYSATRDGRWSKGASVLLGATAQAHAEVLIVADADVIPEWANVLAALHAIEHGTPWAIPHSNVRRLSRAATERVYTEGADPWHGEVDYAHRGMAGGGVVILPRETLLRVPMDPRFLGWGNEDESWAMALRVLAGPPLRLAGDLTHLWHPRAPRLDPHRGSIESAALRDRYRAAKKDPAAMRAIIAEFTKGA